MSDNKGLGGRQGHTMERRHLNSLAVMVVCVAIGVMLVAMLMSDMQRARPPAVSEEPSERSTPGLRPDELLNRVKR